MTWAGLLVLACSGLTLWALLPRNGKTRRLVGTEFEPYVAAVIVVGVGVGICMIFAGLTGF